MESGRKNHECGVKRSGFKYSLCFKYGVNYLISLYLTFKISKWKTRCPQGSTVLLKSSTGSCRRAGTELLQKSNAKTRWNAEVTPSSTPFTSVHDTHFSAHAAARVAHSRLVQRLALGGPEEVMMIAYPVSSMESCEGQ